MFMRKRIYLDNSATTAVAPEVLEAMLPYFTEEIGNASSIHSFGQKAKAAVDSARRKVAELIAAEPNEIVFVSGGTEADNLAIKGIAQAHSARGRHIITSKIEHPAVINTCAALEKQGFAVTYLPVYENGIVRVDDLRDAIRDETILISVMHANNEIGAIQPIEEIGAVVKEIRASGHRHIYFHTDAVQSAGKIPIDVNRLGVDLLSISGHKIHAPKGIGALYVRKGVKLASQQHGGHHERDRRAGTENVAGIVGLGKAAELARSHLAEQIEHTRSLRDYLEAGAQERIPYVQVNGDPVRRLPNISNMSFRFIEGEGILISLDLKGIAVSTGSACSSGSLEPSHVLAALGLPPEIARGSLRFSLSRYNTREEIDYLLEVLPEVVARLRKISPLYKRATDSAPVEI